MLESEVVQHELICDSPAYSSQLGSMNRTLLEATSMRNMFQTLRILNHSDCDKIRKHLDNSI